MLIYHHFMHFANLSLREDFTAHAKHFWKVRGGDGLQ